MTTVTPIKSARTAQQAVLAVMNEVQAVGKNDKNTSQGFKFRGIDAVMNAVGPAFRKHGAFVVPTIVWNTNEIVPTKAGGSLNVCRLQVEFAIYGESGDPIVGSVYAEAMDSGDKAGAKAHSVALRTFLLQVLCLPTDEPDPDTHSYEIGSVTGPSVAELKSKIAAHFEGKPKSEITAALLKATNKSMGWTANELQGFLDTLEASK
jgi:hypothetical protein